MFEYGKDSNDGASKMQTPNFPEAHGCSGKGFLYTL